MTTEVVVEQVLEDDLDRSRSAPRASATLGRYKITILASFRAEYILLAK